MIQLKTLEVKIAYKPCNSSMIERSRLLNRSMG